MFSRVCACVRVRAYIQVTLYIWRLWGYGLRVSQTEEKDMLEKDIVKSILKYLKTVPNCCVSEKRMANQNERIRHS